MADSTNPRQADHPIEPIFLDRWSPRAFTTEEIPVATLMSIFEAGRWAPSSYNSQPWRFVYARRGTAHFDTLVDILIPFNAGWAKHAAALVYIVSSETMMTPTSPDPVPSWTHSFDAGAAWMAMALQATMLGWHAHGMIGFDRDKARTALKVPDGFRVEAAFVIGRRGDAAQLDEALKARETPSPRRPLGESAFEGTFPSA